LPKHFRQLPPACDFIVVDAITALAAPCPEAAVIDFFTSCKRLSAQGKTMALSVDSFAFGSEMFVRLGTLCDSYLSLRSEKVRERRCAR
jgi:archaellum biogenesis ATPase FlaH